MLIRGIEVGAIVNLNKHLRSEIVWRIDVFKRLPGIRKVGDRLGPRHRTKNDASTSGANGWTALRDSGKPGSAVMSWVLAKAADVGGCIANRTGINGGI